MKKALILVLSLITIISASCVSDKPNYTGKQKHKQKHHQVKKKKLSKKDCDCPTFD